MQRQNCHPEAVSIGVMAQDTAGDWDHRGERALSNFLHSWALDFGFGSGIRHVHSDSGITHQVDAREEAAQEHHIVIKEFF